MENTSDERVSFWRVNKNHMHAFFYGLNSTVEDNSKQNRQNQTGVTIKWSQVPTVRLKGRATSPFLVSL